MHSISKSILTLTLLPLALASTAKLLNNNHKYGTLSFDEYDRPGAAIDQDILDMVDKMTIQEKIGQMTQINQDLVMGKDGILNRTAVEHYAKNYYIGSYLNQLASDGNNYDSVDYARLIEEIQEITLSVNSTFKIPIIYGLDHIHGAHYVANTTIFPHGINIAASFNPALAYESASITARDTRAAGVQWTFAPVLDIPVSKQWPRVYENFGEDPHLSSVMGAASIRGYQGKYKSDRSKVAACMKHFIAYGAPWSGQDRDSTVVSERTIHDMFVPGFQAAIDAGVATAMESYIDINGEPVVASNKYLRQLLRGQMGFQGMLVTDWQEIENLHIKHMVASTHKEAVRMAISDTSIDMSMVPQDVIFFDSMMELVKENKISMDRVDESVARLLQLKKDLGLLEPMGWKADKELQEMVGNEKDVVVSLNAARESLTLLKNVNKTLPLKAKKILVVGPTANNLAHLSGGWTIDWQGPTDDHWHGNVNDSQFYEKGITIVGGMKSFAPEGVEVEYMTGFDINGVDENMDQILEVAKYCDAIVVCIGEHVYSELPGNIHDIKLPQDQIDHTARLSSMTDVPLVTVLLEGRPRVMDTIHDNSDAILLAYLPGPWGGQAIAEVLFGQTNPSGKLPYTYPKYVGDVNLNYWRPVSDVWDPLYEFGHGLSYSTFKYSNITYLGNEEDSSEGSHPKYTLVTGDSAKEIEVNITNTSPVDGMETVLMYVKQPFRLLTPPSKLLKAFKKVFIPTGKTETVRFNVSAELFEYTGLNEIPRGTIDNGAVKVLIGDQDFDFEVVNNIV